MTFQGSQQLQLVALLCRDGMDRLRKTYLKHINTTFLLKPVKCMLKMEREKHLQVPLAK